jgi:NAD(P)-dependent dehydrogenase (short-subunit alcohol dehydrogenase family)
MSPTPSQRSSFFGPLNPTIETWAGYRVWVVGASSGIGAELARTLHRRGARVALSARRLDALREVMANAPAPPVDAEDPTLPPEFIALDVNDAQAVAEACAGLQARWGGIDLVLWVAGIYTPMQAQNFDLPTANRMLQTNLIAVYNGLAAVLPMLLSQGKGGIALVSSVAGYSGLPQALVYGPTKAAMINLAESLYFDLRPAGVGIYLVSPGYVDTPATAGNQYTMPALISASQAASETLDGIAAGRFEVHYPKRFTRFLKFARLLPYRLYFALVRRVTGQ